MIDKKQIVSILAEIALRETTSPENIIKKWNDDSDKITQHGEEYAFAIDGKNESDLSEKDAKKIIEKLKLKAVYTPAFKDYTQYFSTKKIEKRIEELTKEKEEMLAGLKVVTGELAGFKNAK